MSWQIYKESEAMPYGLILQDRADKIFGLAKAAAI